MRICGYCTKELNEDQFYPGKAKCKSCQAAYKRDLRKGIHHPIEKPDVKECRECHKSDTDMMPNANICVPCNKVYMQNYRQENRSKLNKQINDWKKTNHEHYREQERKHYNTPEGKAKHVARVEKTPRSWLSHLLGKPKSTSANPGPHDPKSGPRCDYNLDLDYVCELWEKQNGKCAITNMQMLTEYNNLMAVSVDRIDSSKGHVKGNIQLVCQFVNFAKRHHTNQEMINIIK